MSDIAVKDTYKRQGINLVPIPKGAGKALIVPGGWTKYQSEMYTGDIPDDHDFAVILGKVSGNLITLDFDNCDDIEELNKIKKDVLNCTLVVRTGDGYHMYLRIDELPKKANTFLYKEKYGMEVKGNGAYVVGASCDHYDKDDDGKYFLSGKKYTVVSNTTNIMHLHTSGEKMIEKLVELGWIAKNQTDSDDQHISTSTADLERGGWLAGERYNNGFKLALRRFHSNVDHEEVLNEAIKLNETCVPKHSMSEVERWVNDAHTQWQKNLKNPDQKYFKPYDPNFTKNEQGGKDDEESEEERIAFMIQNNRYFKCFKDTDELILYEDGIYQSGLAEPYIKEECEKWIKNCTTHQRNEVVNKIKVMNYIRRDEFDKSLALIVKNCKLDIGPIKQSAHSPNNLSRTLIPRNYIEPKHTINDETIFKDIEKNLNETLFWKYLIRSFTVDGKFDRENFECVLEMMASILVKENVDSRAFMNLGVGDNGKSILLEYLSTMIGINNVKHIALQKIEEDKFAASDLDGAMANIYADLAPNELRKTGQIKLILSNEGIFVQKKHEKGYTLYPHASFIFSANRFPRVHDQSQGFFRRWIIIKWRRNFEDDPERDEHLKEKLLSNEEEMDLVFSCLISLAGKLKKRGKFTHSKKWRETQKDWNANSDPIDEFVVKCTRESDSNMSKREMYTYYKDYLFGLGETPLKFRPFNREFAESYDEDVVKNNETKRAEKVWLNVRFVESKQTEMKDHDTATAN